MTSGVEKVYAEALYELAAETGEKERLFDELMGLAKVFSDNPGLCDVLQAPTVTNEEKYTMLKNIFASACSRGRDAHAIWRVSPRNIRRCGMPKITSWTLR